MTQDACMHDFQYIHVVPGTYDLLKCIFYWISIKRHSAKSKCYVHFFFFPLWELLEKWGLKIIVNKFIPVLHLFIHYIRTWLFVSLYWYSGCVHVRAMTMSDPGLFVKPICSKWYISTGVNIINSLKNTHLLCVCVSPSLSPSLSLYLQLVKTQFN